MNKIFSNHDIDILDSPLSELEYVVFDLETTGIDFLMGHKIIEIGAVKIKKNFRLAEKFITFVNPNRPIPKKATLINGITDRDVKNAPEFNYVIYDFLDFAKNAILVAHNASHDISFLKYEMQEYLLNFPEFIVFDTQKLFNNLYPYYSHNSLDLIIEKFHFKKVENGFSRHRALYDAIVTAKAFIKMLRILQETYFTTLIELQDYLKHT
jgi:DNA polymerase-3 subunit alpha (Gram-positive type)